jgi:hypothetical protein
MNKVNEIFGWSAKAWSIPFLLALNEFHIPESAKILELGASNFSAVALYFANSHHDLNITSYPEEKIPGLLRFVKNFCDENTFELPRIFCMSAKEVIGEYDLIIMKSVLGGVFRKGSGTNDDVMHLVHHIVEHNLKPGGVLITLDNGATFLESFFSKFGARANRWRFFVPSDFTKYTKQYCFGLLSSASFVTRFGKIGYVIEDILCAIDLFIFKMVKISRASVIVTLYKVPFDSQRG